MRALSEAALRRRGLTISRSDGQLQEVDQIIGLDKLTGEQIRAPGVRWTDPATGDTLTPDPGWSHNPARAGAEILEERMRERAAALAEQAGGAAKAALEALARGGGSDALAAAPPRGTIHR